MPWLEQRPNGRYHVVFRFGGQKLKKSLRTSDARNAEARLQQLEENIRLVEKGRIELPDDADVVEYLLSNGKLDGKPHSNTSLRTLKQFAEAYLDSIPAGSLEINTVKGMRIHLGHLYRGIKKSFLLKSLNLGDLQQYVELRSQDDGQRGRKLKAYPRTVAARRAVMAN